MMPKAVPSDRPILARLRLDTSTEAVAVFGDPAEADALPMVVSWLDRDPTGSFRWRCPVAGLGNLEVVDEATWSIRPLGAATFDPMARAS
jgi:hypothetical protein